MGRRVPKEQEQEHRQREEQGHARGNQGATALGTLTRDESRPIVSPMSFRKATLPTDHITNKQTNKQTNKPHCSLSRWRICAGTHVKSSRFASDPDGSASAARIIVMRAPSVSSAACTSAPLRQRARARMLASMLGACVHAEASIGARRKLSAYEGGSGPPRRPTAGFRARVSGIDRQPIYR